MLRILSGRIKPSEGNVHLPKGTVIGFLTQETMSEFGMDDFCAVYFPNSYAISGEILIVKKEKIEKIDADSGDVTKFILSGGVTEMK